MDEQPLKDHVALVAGGTRGAGRAIAEELGSVGATVYVTGRSTRSSRSGEPPDTTLNRPGTIEETAERVTTRGGRGVAVAVDHTVPAEVAALVERIDREQDGRLDLVVNDIWGGDPLTSWDTPFWEHDLRNGMRIQELGLHTHILTAWHAAPLLVGQGGGLIVEMTDGISPEYRGNRFYDLAKAAVIRLALAEAEDQRPRGVAVVALTPGFLRSEAVLDHLGVTEEDWLDGVARDRHFATSEAPYFVARAVVALATDPYVFAKTGQAFASWDLAKEYGFTDVDGARPDWGSYFERGVKKAG